MRTYFFILVDSSLIVRGGESPVNALLRYNRYIIHKTVQLCVESCADVYLIRLYLSVWKTPREFSHRLYCLISSKSSIVHSSFLSCSWFASLFFDKFLEISSINRYFFLFFFLSMTFLNFMFMLMVKEIEFVMDSCVWLIFHRRQTLHEVFYLDGSQYLRVIMNYILYINW